MKTTLKILLSFLVLTITLTGCAQNATESRAIETSKPGVVKVYYFHFNARCATCRAIEAEARSCVGNLSDEHVSFLAYNLDEDAGKAKGEELGVSGQTLLVVGGNQKIDLTREGFLYARTEAGKFRQLLEEKIKSVL